MSVNHLHLTVPGVDREAKVAIRGRMVADGLDVGTPGGFPVEVGA